MTAYSDNLREVVNTVIDADTVGAAVRQMAAKGKFGKEPPRVC